MITGTIAFMDSILSHIGIPLFITVLIFRIAYAIATIITAFVAYKITKTIMEKVIHQLIKKTKFEWDDVFIEKNVLSRLAHLAPALVLYYIGHAVFFDSAALTTLVRRIALIYMALSGVMVVDAILSSFIVILRPHETRYKMPFGTVLQALKVAFYVITLIVVTSLVLGKSPDLLLTGLAGLTAVTMLIFKDPILGFVGGIQLTANDMVRRGDWIEMPQYGADGDVIDISLTTVKVQNWDKTITTIPTYALVANSFKNWRGMSESGGRRVCRSINLDMSSIKFCDEKMLEKFQKIQYIADYIDEKKRDIDEHNQSKNIDDSVLVNGRHMTNIGTFRAYIVAYLQNHPDVYQEGMTFLVRQLAPTENGLPIQIYVFLKEQRWAFYEAIQSDIFDHLLSVVPEFDLRVFQNPTGHDMQAMATGGKK
jgi:miniconductance mechanosensitive channel